MPKGKPKTASLWDTLPVLIESYADACRADQDKGGGDPDAIPVIEAELELARAKLNAHLSHMRREYE